MQQCLCKQWSSVAQRNKIYGALDTQTGLVSMGQFTAVPLKGPIKYGI